MNTSQYIGAWVGCAPLKQPRTMAQQKKGIYVDWFMHKSHIKQK